MRFPGASETVVHSRAEETRDFIKKHYNWSVPQQKQFKQLGITWALNSKRLLQNHFDWLHRSLMLVYALGERLDWNKWPVVLDFGGFVLDGQAHFRTAASRNQHHGQLRDDCGRVSAQRTALGQRRTYYSTTDSFRTAAAGFQHHG